jgi:hypothetical protein
LVTDALQMALARHQPEAGVIHHSDQGPNTSRLPSARRPRRRHRHLDGAELKALEAGIPEADRIGAEELVDIYYGPLSELTHPNWAALTLGTSLDPTKPLEVPDRIGFEEGGVLHDVVASSSYILERGGAAFDAVLDALRRTSMDLPNRDPDWNEGDIRPVSAGQAEAS